MSVTPFGTPVMVRATSGSVTGSWGSGQNRVAGAILTAIVTAGGSTATAAAISTPSGWTQQAVISNTPTTANAWVAAYTKVAAGGDSAPAFTATLSGTAAMTCTLLESAAGNCVTPVDTSGTYASGGTAGTLSAMTATTNGNVSAAGEYAIAAWCQEAAAATNSWNHGSGWTSAVSDGATSSVLHTAVDVLAAPAAGSALTETGHWTTDTSAFGAGLILVIAAETGGLETFANQAATTITSGGSDAPASGTAEYWTAASWASFGTASPQATPPTHFHVADTASPAEAAELIAVLNTSTGLVIRGAEGTTPVSHASGFTIQNVVPAGTLGDFSQVYNVRSLTYGAAGNGTTDDTAAIQAALNACISAGGGVVYLPAGSYKTTSVITGVLPTGVTVLIAGAGYQATTIYSHVTGDCIRLWNPTPFAYGAMSWRSGVTDLTIDGTSAGAGSSGLHAGDIGIMKLDLCIQNFTGTGSTGLHLDNAVNWTEEADIRATLINNTVNVKLDVTTGSSSYAYGNFDFTVFAAAGQDGVVLNDGAFLYHCNLRIRGNFTASTTADTAAVLRMTGAASAGPNEGATSELILSHVQIMVECDNPTGAGPFYGPYTIWMDPVNYAFMGLCYGILDFTNGNGTFAPASFESGQIAFNGIVGGDTNLNPGSAPGWLSLGTPVIFPGLAAFEGYCPTATDDFFEVGPLSANTTILLNYSGIYSGDTIAGPQMKFFRITQAASGGPYTVTWPSSGSPSVSSPNVVWPGGSAPLMSQSASAVDGYVLYTYDGATWFGTAMQASTVPDAEQFQSLTTARTLTANTSAQALFNATANGAVTVAGSTTYFFKALLDVTGLSSSSHTIDFGLGGSATYTSVMYNAITATAAGGATSSFIVTSYTATAITAANTGTVLQAVIEGTMRVNAGGTVIPQITQVTADAAASVAVNSSFRLWPVGSNTVTNVGNWS